MDQVVAQLSEKFPHFSFCASNAFCWSPERKEICFNTKDFKPSHIWSLFHETGHALLQHQNYRTDLELIKLEVAAWDRAVELAKDFEMIIDSDYVQDCLDTYRDWLYRRSICPNCSTKSLQQGTTMSYKCFNCRAIWQVTPSRFCRAYRARLPQKTSPVFQATFGN